MTPPASLSPETLNIIAAGAAAVVAGAIGMFNYLRKEKPVATREGDRMIPGITIADMEPVRQLAKEQARAADAAERTASALEKMLELSEARAEDAEIVRRAEIMAQKMLEQLQTAAPPRRRT